MLAIALLVASADIKDAWIRSDTHPVYNSRIVPFDMGLPRIADTDLRVDLAAERAELEKSIDDLAVSHGVMCRFGIEAMNEEIKAESLKPKPDAQRIANCEKLRSSFQEGTLRYAGRLMMNPTLEPRIKAELEKLRKEMK